AIRTICGALVEETPSLAADVVFGAMTCLGLEDEFARRMLGEWSAWVSTSTSTPTWSCAPAARCCYAASTASRTTRAACIAPPGRSVRCVGAASQPSSRGATALTRSFRSGRDRRTGFALVASLDEDQRAMRIEAAHVGHRQS